MFCDSITFSTILTVVPRSHVFLGIAACHWIFQVPVKGGRDYII